MSILFEKKDHLIKKLDMTEEEKQKLIDFFASHTNLESKINWNRKDLTMKDFQDVFNIATKSRGFIKKNGLTAFTEGVDYVDVSDKFFAQGVGLALIPKTYEFEKWYQSENDLGPEGEWCIGSQRTNEHWLEYINSGHIFVGLSNGSAKLMIDLDTRKFSELEEEYDQSFDPFTIFDSRDYVFFIKKLLEGTKVFSTDEEQDLFESMKIKTYEEFTEVALSLYKEQVKIDREKYVKQLKEYVESGVKDTNYLQSLLNNYYNTFVEGYYEVSETFYEVLSKIDDSWELFARANFRYMYVDWKKVHFNNMNSYISLFYKTAWLPGDLNDLILDKNKSTEAMFAEARGGIVDISKWPLDLNYRKMFYRAKATFVVTQQQKDVIMEGLKEPREAKLLLVENIKNNLIFDHIYRESVTN